MKNVLFIVLLMMGLSLAAQSTKPIFEREGDLVKASLENGFFGRVKF